MSEGKYGPRPGHIPGAVVNLGGHELVLAPLNLDGVRDAEPILARMADLTQPQELLRASAEMLLLSLQRNYTDMTLEDVLALVDMEAAPLAIAALTNASGYRKATPGELTPAPQ